jgi:HEPN domain-containing protein
MPARNPIIAVIREWLLKAEHDLLTAAHTLTLGVECPTDTVCFHAQQCVEKHIKALLVFRATPFPKTRDTVRRYPGAGPEVPLAEARKAVAIARRIRKEVRKHLPRAALRREQK